jgi:hypothetical protein
MSPTGINARCFRLIVARRNFKGDNVSRYARGLALLGLLWSVPAWAQLPVTDLGNLAVNTEAASQSTITAVHMVLSVANEVLELTPVEEVIVAAQIAEDLAILGDIVAEANLLSFDVQSLNAQITVLFGLDNAPTTRTGLDARIAEIKRLYHQSLLFAARTQTLILTVFRTIDHLTRLIDSIGALIGNLQANQTLVQVNSTMGKTLVVMETQQAAWQRAETLQRLTDMAVIESLNRINEDRLIDHPR